MTHSGRVCPYQHNKLNNRAQIEARTVTAPGSCCTAPAGTLSPPDTTTRLCQAHGRVGCTLSSPPHTAPHSCISPDAAWLQVLYHYCLLDSTKETRRLHLPTPSLTECSLGMRLSTFPPVCFGDHTYTHVLNEHQELSSVSLGVRVSICMPTSSHCSASMLPPRVSILWM